jgi:hypothetical protein
MFLGFLGWFKPKGAGGAWETPYLVILALMLRNVKGNLVRGRRMFVRCPSRLYIYIFILLTQVGPLPPPSPLLAMISIAYACFYAGEVF